MIVVSDTSPLIALLNIGKIDLLPKLFGEVIVPSAVIDELARPNRPPQVSAFIKEPPRWLVLREPRSVSPIPKLHAGELAALFLARELAADLLLIDEFRGRKAATGRGLQIAGAVGILEMAAYRNLIELPEAFEQLKRIDFWISRKILDESLTRFLTKTKPGGMSKRPEPN